MSPNEDVREQAAWALGNVAGDKRKETFFARIQYETYLIALKMWKKFLHWIEMRNECVVSKSILIYLPFSLFISPFLSLSISASLSLCLSLYLSLCLSLSLCFSVSLSLSHTHTPCLSLSLCLSLSHSLSLSFRWLCGLQRSCSRPGSTTCTAASQFGKSRTVNRREIIEAEKLKRFLHILSLIISYLSLSPCISPSHSVSPFFLSPFYFLSISFSSSVTLSLSHSLLSFCPPLLNLLSLHSTPPPPLN